MLGVAERFAWAWSHRLEEPGTGGEMANVARSFATNFTLADAYRVGQGATAHVMPFPPIFAGSIYHLFGVRSALSEILLLSCATVIVFISFGLGYLLMRELGSPKIARFLALIFLLVMPLNMRSELLDFRIWEGALAAALAIGFLLVLVRFDRLGCIDVRHTLVLGAFAALLLFVSPPLGVPAYMCSLIFMVTRQPARLWPRTIAIAAGLLVLVLAPWTVRNQAVLGHPIPLRSNFGLELAIGMNPAALAPLDPEAAFKTRLAMLHPLVSDIAYDRMRKMGGEVPYFGALQTATLAWMRSHPLDTSRLVLRHVRQYFFPSPWMWTLRWEGLFHKGSPQMVLTWITAAFGLAGAAAAAMRGRRWLYVVLMLMMPVILYAMTQPILRYRYIGYALLIYLGADLIGRALRRLPLLGLAKLEAVEAQAGRPIKDSAEA